MSPRKSSTDVLTMLPVQRQTESITQHQLRDLEELIQEELEGSAMRAEGVAAAALLTKRGKRLPIPAEAQTLMLDAKGESKYLFIVALPVTN